MIIVNHPFYLLHNAKSAVFCGKILSMKEYAIRLTKGQDLKQSIVAYVLEHDIKCGVIVSSVGCLKNYRLRNAGATRVIEKTGHFEILALNGTIASGKVHLHLTVGDQELNAFGGHLVDGNIVNTTVELVILELEDFTAHREFDPKTNYDEIVFERRTQ